MPLQGGLLGGSLPGALVGPLGLPCPGLYQCCPSGNRVFRWHLCTPFRAAIHFAAFLRFLCLLWPMIFHPVHPCPNSGQVRLPLQGGLLGGSLPGASGGPHGGPQGRTKRSSSARWASLAPGYIIAALQAARHFDGICVRRSVPLFIFDCFLRFLCLLRPMIFHPVHPVHPCPNSGHLYS